MSKIENCAAPRAFRLRVAVLATMLIVLAGSVGLIAWEKLGTRPERRDDLWRVVHDVCSSDQRVLQHSTPCIEVDRANGFALVPGGIRSDEVLLVPTRRITGIEDPALLDPATPNYWALAWGARHYLLKGNPVVPDRWVGLAVNSALSRTQDQLHIHIDCVKPEVREALDLHAPSARQWSVISPLPGHRYQVRTIGIANLRSTSPFRMLAHAVGSAPDTLARQTLVLIGAPSSQQGATFYLLRQAYRSEAGAIGHGEELLDHRCVGVKDLPTRRAAN